MSDGCRAKVGIGCAGERGWKQGHHMYCIYHSKQQGSEGKEGMDKNDEGRDKFFKGVNFEA